MFIHTSSLCALAIFFLHAAATVDIVMSQLQCDPSYWPECEPLERLFTSTCRNISQGLCCNNIFFYRDVRVTGLRPGNAAFTFHRGRWSLGVSADARDRRPFERATRVYSCEGDVLKVGIGNREGLWHYRGRYRQSASGSMWLNCAHDPTRALRAALRPRPAEMSRSALGTLIRVVAHECAALFAKRKRASYGNAGAGDTASRSSVSEAEEAARPPDSDEASPPEADNAMSPAKGCVLPDLVTYNGTQYEARVPGEARYYDAQGAMLNMTLAVDEIATAAQAVAPEPAPSPSPPL
ncbi:MAG: hypothetical protein M1832_004199 [Thelocarpon impressellum]|nr:MAG: hypothetical protein M1832_004199 [Thelocarpon impressellum]